MAIRGGARFEGPVLSELEGLEWTRGWQAAKADAGCAGHADRRGNGGDFVQPHCAAIGDGVTWQPESGFGLAVFPVAVTEKALVELAGRLAWQCVLEVDCFRSLVAGQVLAAEGDPTIG